LGKKVELGNGWVDVIAVNKYVSKLRKEKLEKKCFQKLINKEWKNKFLGLAGWPADFIQV
jgi:hypothetical protein